MIEALILFIKRRIPQKLFTELQPYYHKTLSLLGAILYLFPSRKLFVIGITGTKGKTTTAEVINALLEEAGYKTALASTLRFKIDDRSERNPYKMTMPGRFTLQRFLRKAVRNKCEYAVIEITSEGVVQFRHKNIYLNALIFTNISPEHIESHGSYENYLSAKLEIAYALGASPKRPRYMVANKDDKESPKFLAVDVEKKITFGFDSVNNLELAETYSKFTWNDIQVHTHLPGKFNVYNVLAGLSLAYALGIPPDVLRDGIKSLGGVRGRMERIVVEKENHTLFNDFDVIIDYAHTPDSLEKVYMALEGRPKICVLGGTGGGRDKWKRPIMGNIAAKYCKKIILTDEDPYDENPKQIVLEIEKGILEKEKSAEVEMDRQKAIRKAITVAKKNDVVIITGKGTDPFIMGPNGSKIPWDDAAIAREELIRIVSEH